LERKKLKEETAHAPNQNCASKNGHLTALASAIPSIKGEILRGKGGEMGSSSKYLRAKKGKGC